MNEEDLVLSVVRDRVKTLDEITKMQCSDGNWNADPYMHGMANGMILSLSTITGEEPTFLESPQRWLSAKKEAIVILSSIENFNKIAISFGELVNNTSLRSKKYVKRCIPRLFRSYPEKGLWIFKVKGMEPWSKGINTVRLQLLGKGIKTVGILGREISVSCTCEAWKFLGADFNALSGGYSEQQLSDGRPPKVRDPRRKFKICKHVASCMPLFKNIEIPANFK